MSAGEEAVRRRQEVPAGKVLGVAVLGSGLAFVDATIVNVAFPDIGRDFDDASLGGLSWVLNAYNIVFAALLVPAGRVADLLGRRRLFTLGVLLFTIASVLCALAPTLETLVAARVLQAIGAAIVVPSSLAIVLRAYPAEDRTRGVALWSASAALAAGLGPSLGGALVELGGWRLAFLVNLPLGLLAIRAARRTIVESRAPGRRTRPDLVGALVLAAGTASLTYGIVQAPDRGWTDPVVLVAAAVAAGLLAHLVARSRTHPSPMLDLELLRIRSVAVANVVTIVGAAGFYGYVLCNVLFLTAVWDLSVLEAGLALTPGPIVAAAVARPAGRLADRVGAAKVIAAGATAWAAGVAVLIAVVDPTPDLAEEWLPAMALLGLGAGVTFPIVGAAAVAAVDDGRYAGATGLNSIARQLGAVLGVALLVAIVGTPDPADLPGAFDDGWTFAAGCFLLAAALATRLGALPKPVAAAAPQAPPPRPLAPPAAPARPARRPAPVPLVSRTAAEVLEGVPLFAGLREELRLELAGLATRVRIDGGDALLRQGEPGDALFVLLAGRMEVRRDGELVNELGPGAIIGELALITGEPRAATVLARRDGELLRLGRDAFDRALREDPEFGRALLRTLATQLASTRGEPVPRTDAQVLALVPLVPGLPVDALRDDLLVALAHRGPACHLGPVTSDAAGLEQLERLEAAHTSVVLVAGAVADAWTAFCVRHADRVVVLAPAGHRPPGTAPDPRLRGCDLVAVDTGEGVAVGPWLDALEPRSRHLVRARDRSATTAAAARRIAGCSVGLVLSGGGARGLAHIGVLEVLEEAGIVVDRVAGASFGALIAAFAATGMRAAEVDAVVYDELLRRNPLDDHRWPSVSWIHGRKVSDVMQRQFPQQIEDLPVDFFAVSTDLVTGELHEHRRGSLADACMASFSIPGWAPPLVRDGRVLVDGGVLNNMPVDRMAARGEGPVIAVDLTTQSDWTAIAAGHVQGDDTTMPRLADTLLRSLTLGSLEASHRATEQAALVIRPDNAGAGTFEFHQLDALREAGRRAAVEALAAAPAELFGAPAATGPGVQVWTLPAARRAPGTAMTDDHDHETTTDEPQPGEGPAGIRPGGDATVAERGDLDPAAVAEAKRKLEQAGGGH